MTSDISTGTITQSGTRTFVSGTVSGLDTNGLIEVAVSSNNAAADRIDVTINENQSEIDAYQEFFGLATNLQGSTDNLKANTSLASSSTNVFEQRNADLSSTGAEPTGLLDITINPGAPQGAYQIIVEQKAEAFSTGSISITDKDAALGYTGDFDIGLDGFSDINIAVTATDTLQDIADQINANSDDSGVSANILRVSETEFQLILTGAQENTALNVTTNNGNVLQSLGILDGADAFEAAQIIQNEQGSRVTFDGATITRDDNNYDDLITGIEFSIRASDTNSIITIDVGNEVSAAKTEIEDFIDFYNEFRDFVITNQQVNADGTLPEDAVLFGDNLLSIISNDIFDILNTFRNDNGAVTNISDLGLGFDQNNNLLLESSTTLDDALINNFEDVRNFFTTSFETSDSNLGFIGNTNTQGDLSFDLDITVNADGSIASAFADGIALDVSGTAINGAQGTIYEGLTFAYVGGANTTISVDIKAGIADRISAAIEGFVNPVDGLIQTEINTLTTVNEDLTEEAEAIRTRGEEIRETEIDRYAALEAALARAETLQNTLRALLGIDDN